MVLAVLSLATLEHTPGLLAILGSLLNSSHSRLTFLQQTVSHGGVLTVLVGLVRGAQRSKGQ